jgi:hypothetical protein
MLSRKEANFSLTVRDKAIQKCLKACAFITQWLWHKLIELNQFEYDNISIYSPSYLFLFPLSYMNYFIIVNSLLTCFFKYKFILIFSPKFLNRFLLLSLVCWVWSFMHFSNLFTRTYSGWIQLNKEEFLILRCRFLKSTAVFVTLLLFS